MIGKLKNQYTSKIFHRLKDGVKGSWLYLIYTKNEKERYFSQFQVFMNQTSILKLITVTCTFEKSTLLNILDVKTMKRHSLQ